METSFVAQLFQVDNNMNSLLKVLSVTALLSAVVSAQYGMPPPQRLVPPAAYGTPMRVPQMPLGAFKGPSFPMGGQSQFGAGFAAGPSMISPYAAVPGGYNAPPRYQPSFPQGAGGYGPALPPSIQPPMYRGSKIPSMPFPSFPSFPSPFPGGAPPTSGYGAPLQPMPVGPSSQFGAVGLPMPVIPSQQYSGAQQSPQSFGADSSSGYATGSGSNTLNAAQLSAIAGAQQAGSSYSAPLTSTSYGMGGDVPTYGVQPAAPQQPQSYGSSSGAQSGQQLGQFDGGAQSSYGSSSSLSGAQLGQLGANDATYGSSAVGGQLSQFGGSSASQANFTPMSASSYSSEQSPPAPGNSY